MAETDVWNPWHGCRKVSAGCKNCYVYVIDMAYGRNPTHVFKTQAFQLPVKKNRQGEYKYHQDGYVYTCLTSDFFIEEADEWRQEAWEMMKIRSDLQFYIITKRIHRFMKCVPADWGDGYPNVTIGCTIENQQLADERLPIFHDCPIQHKQLVCEPLLSDIDFGPYLEDVEGLIVGGESGSRARICRYEWFEHIREQCLKAESKPSLWFQQTGANFEKDGEMLKVPRKQQFTLAHSYELDLIYESGN